VKNKNGNKIGDQKAPSISKNSNTLCGGPNPIGLLIDDPLIAILAFFLGISQLKIGDRGDDGS